MRIAALYDIHGNLPALEAVLADVTSGGVDRVVVGGDVVPGPMPRETLDRLRDLTVPTSFVYGNGETDTLAELDGGASRVPERFRDVVRWSGEALGEEGRVFVRRWPATVRASVPGLGEVLFCHATPTSDTAIFTRVTPEDDVAGLLEGADADVVVCGHTHMQFDRTVGRLRVVNAGSVGMPVGEPGAYWLLIGPDVELRRTAYDGEGAAARLRASRYPGIEAFVEQALLHPPTEARMLEVLGGAAG